ncbi:MAG: hypothetical protein EHM20_10620 [Alphaproteobacteria bacterium]|nr:MAG: hypothetical protein EHM20_10620 [Alphaproteobacteria bacterium]
MRRFFAVFLIGSLISCSGHSQDQKASLSQKELSLFDLRIPESEYTEKMQEVRERKLEIHEHMGKITAGLAAVTVLTAMFAKRSTNRDRARRGGTTDPSDADNFTPHMISAGLTLASYFTTAYFSITAPKADVLHDLDSVKWHKRLSFIHMPAMIIGPFLGLKAISDYRKGKNPTGIAKLHRPLMLLGATALAGAVIVVEF